MERCALQARADRSDAKGSDRAAESIDRREAKEWLSRPVEPEVMRPIVIVEAPARAPVEGRVINSEPI